MADSCQAYLIVDTNAEALVPPSLAQLLRRRPIACVLLRSKTAAADRLKALVTAGQLANCAMLIENDAALALQVGADGVHIAFPGTIEAAERQFGEARRVLGANRIVGAGAGLLRHDAMVLAELGADYVALGDGEVVEPERLLEHVVWWAEMFEVPCVAWTAADRDGAARLAEAGADFVAAGPAGDIESALEVLAGVNDCKRYAFD